MTPTASHKFRSRVAWQERARIAGPDELAAEEWTTWLRDRAAVQTGGGGERTIDNASTEQTANCRLTLRWNPAYGARWNDLLHMRIVSQTGEIFHPRGVHNVEGLNREILIEATSANDTDRQVAEDLSV
jgi:hypothetical protein